MLVLEGMIHTLFECIYQYGPQGRVIHFHTMQSGFKQVALGTTAHITTAYHAIRDA